MHRWFWIFIVCLVCAPLLAQEEEVGALTEQELSVIEAIKAQNRVEEATTVVEQKPITPQEDPSDSAEIKLPEEAKQTAWEEQKQEPLPDWEPVVSQDAVAEGEENSKCTTVAFIDIDVAFNEHPRTQAVKKHIDVKIQSKQREVENAKDIIAALEAENKLLTRQLAEIKPFYERIVTEQVLLPKAEEAADTLVLNNMLNRLLFAGCEPLSTSPLNSPARLDDITERIGANKKIIAERSFFIDNYKYQTREEILLLEQQEVKRILQDIYSEIKSFAKKRNIGAIVRKDEILYGQAPVNVTKDFVNRLKKSKKYRKK